MIHDEIMNRLSGADAPVSTPELASALGLSADAETHALIEIEAVLSTNIRRHGTGWVLSVDTPTRRVLAALRSYATAHPGKRLFRLAAALGELPPQDQPTEEAIRQLLDGSPEFKLLPNAMIKRVS